MSARTAPSGGASVSAPDPDERQRHWGRPALAIAVTLAVAVPLGWWLGAGGGSQAVVFPGGEAFGISLPATLGDQPYSVGSMSLCLDGPSRATVRSVEPAGSTGGLVVDAFAVRQGAVPFGAEGTPLQAAGIASSGELTARCSSGRSAELVVQVSKPDAATARADGLRVRWESGDERGTTDVPLHLVLCGGPDERVPECRAIVQR